MVQSLAPETQKKNGSTARFVGEKAAGQVFPDKANGFEPHRPQAQSVIQNECGPGNQNTKLCLALVRWDLGRLQFSCTCVGWLLLELCMEIKVSPKDQTLFLEIRSQ